MSRQQSKYTTSTRTVNKDHSKQPSNSNKPLSKSTSNTHINDSTDQTRKKQSKPTSGSTTNSSNQNSTTTYKHYHTRASTNQNNTNNYQPTSTNRYALIKSTGKTRPGSRHQNDDDDEDDEDSTSKSSTSTIKNASRLANTDSDNDFSQHHHEYDNYHNTSTTKNDTSDLQPDNSDEQGFITKTSRKQRQNNEKPNKQPSNNINQQSPSKQLPAIKIQLNADATANFSSPIAVAKEIDRCMKATLNIKFAQLKGSILIIATDDPLSHHQLSSDWPKDAFIHGITPINKQRPFIPKTVYIRGVDQGTDINDTYLTKSLTDQGYNNLTRIFNSEMNV